MWQAFLFYSGAKVGAVKYNSGNCTSQTMLKMFW